VTRTCTVLGVTLVYVVITLVMTHPLVNLAALGSSCYPGDARLLIWTMAWDNHAVLDHVPLFNANMFYPTVSSLNYADHLFGISLFTLPIYAATRNPILGYNIVWLLAFPLNGVAMHALVRHYTRSHLAGFVGGVIYAFSQYNLFHSQGHLALIWKWLVPLSLLLFERWSERPTLRRAALWGSAVILQALSAWYLAVIVLVANAALWVWRHAVTVRDEWRTRAIHVGLLCAVGAAALWPFAKHYRELVPPELPEVMRFSADWTAYVMPTENSVVGQWWLAHIGHGPHLIWGERTLFLGWTAMVLAVVGVAAMVVTRQWRAIGGYVLLTGIGFALSFGSHPGSRSAYDLLTLVPGVAGFRAPARFALIVLLGMSMLAAFGVVTLQQRFGRKMTAAVALLIPLMLGEWFMVKFPLGQPQPAPIPAIYFSPYLKTAHALVSLPDYRLTPDWNLEADYLLYSTVTWRPIVNGYGRAEPLSFQHVISHMNAFPGPNNARTMRQLGIEYVVVHTARYHEDVSEFIRVARSMTEYEFMGQVGPDLLFRVRPVPR
jgi:hypothetical protein